MITIVYTLTLAMAPPDCNYIVIVDPEDNIPKKKATQLRDELLDLGDKIGRVPVKRKSRDPKGKALDGDVYIRIGSDGVSVRVAPSDSEAVLDLEDLDIEDLAIALANELKSSQCGKLVPLSYQERVQKTVARGQRDAEKAERSRVTAEKDRVTAEKDRVTAEKDRVTAEKDRAAAEKDRATAEKDRATAEKDRVEVEKDRVTAEKDRATAENGRVTAEENRVTAEENRVTAEENRVTVEENRVEVEENRVTAEENRVTAEGGRVAAENDRAVAEGNREMQEDIRKSQEVERAQVEHIRADAERSRNVSEMFRAEEHRERMKEINRARLSRGALIAIGIGTGVGILASVAGIVLVALDGTCPQRGRSPITDADTCPDVYNTDAAGYGLLAGGIVLVPTIDIAALISLHRKGNR